MDSNWNKGDFVVKLLRDAIWRMARNTKDIYLHKIRRSKYACLGVARVQCSTGPIEEDTSVMVYVDEAGNMYVRPALEFYDGRFEYVVS